VSSLRVLALTVLFPSLSINEIVRGPSMFNQCPSMSHNGSIFSQAICFSVVCLSLKNKSLPFDVIGCCGFDDGGQSLVFWQLAFLDPISYKRGVPSDMYFLYVTVSNLVSVPQYIASASALLFVPPANVCLHLDPVR